MQVDVIFSIIVLVMSVVVHEVSHGLAAEALGDPTARMAGRLTLNPIKHLDFFGSIIMPIITSLLPGGFVLGWAKPVPINPYNLRYQKWGEALVSVAGPLSNILIAVVVGLFVRFSVVAQGIDSPLMSIAVLIIVINLVLAIFNLMPIPPLDGSKILFAFLPMRFYKFREMMESTGLFIALIFVIFLWQFIFPVVFWAFSILTGISIN